MRLQAVNPDRFDARDMNGFEDVSTVHLWRVFLREISRANTPDNLIRDPLASNIAHRLQLLEFETALLLRHKEAARPTLHASVLTFKIQQHAVLCHSVLEGVGAHVWRYHQAVEVPANRRVSARSWRPALADACNYANVDDRNAIVSELETLTGQRDRVHLDTNNPWDRIDYHRFDFQRCFIPSYSLFRTVLTRLSGAWPEGTCLDEEI